MAGGLAALRLCLESESHIVLEVEAITPEIARPALGAFGEEDVKRPHLIRQRCCHLDGIGIGLGRRDDGRSCCDAAVIEVNVRAASQGAPVEGGEYALAGFFVFMAVIGHVQVS
ncbi:MAG TPA: hypothetical protein VEU06_08375 [Micropepsaceae bacterium]|nr:hypothetical protein [Micropepsaceae bacterium]